MRQFLIALLVAWTAGSIAAFFYSQQQHIAKSLFVALLPAFLAEVGLYLGMGFEKCRKAFDSWAPKPVRAALLTSSALLPYLLASVRLGAFDLRNLLLLAAVAGIASFWYALLRASPTADVLFLLLMAAVFLSKIFYSIYPQPAAHLPLEILGKLMWIRVGVLALLSLRGIENVRFGFVPSPREWQVGALQFLWFIPAGVAAALLLHFAHFQPPRLVWWKFLLFVPATFFGVLWVTALGEEFFFRGFLQQLLARGLHSKTAGVLASAAVFGSVHLPYRYFPNWRLALIAGLSGVFYSYAFLRSGSIRASMVTHALVVTVWKSLFAS